MSQRKILQEVPYEFSLQSAENEQGSRCHKEHYLLSAVLPVTDVRNPSVTFDGLHNVVECYEAHLFEKEDSSMDLWKTLQEFEGKTLHTLDQNKPFEILKVTDYACVFAVPTSDAYTHRVRVIYAADLLPLYEQLVRDRELDIHTIKQAFSFSSTYASALLATLEGVTAATRPIRLRLLK